MIRIALFVGMNDDAYDVINIINNNFISVLANS